MYNLTHGGCKKPRRHCFRLITRPCTQPASPSPHRLSFTDLSPARGEGGGLDSNTMNKPQWLVCFCRDPRSLRFYSLPSSFPSFSPSSFGSRADFSSFEARRVKPRLVRTVQLPARLTGNQWALSKMEQGRGRLSAVNSGSSVFLAEKSDY